LELRQSKAILGSLTLEVNQQCVTAFVARVKETKSRIFGDTATSPTAFQIAQPIIIVLITQRLCIAGYCRKNKPGAALFKTGETRIFPGIRAPRTQGQSDLYRSGQRALLLAAETRLSQR
jgi:hypothetical protein